MSVPGSSAVPPSGESSTPVDSSRPGLVSAAVHEWAQAVLDADDRGPLLHYRDLKVGALDLASADPEARKRLLDGVPTVVTRLFPHDPMRSAALRSSRALHSRIGEVHQERGVWIGFLAIGFATWTDPYAVRRPNAPVLLRKVHIEPDGPGARDYLLRVDEDAELNEVLLDSMAARLGLRMTAEDLLDHGGALRYAFVVERLRELAPAHVVDGFAIAHRAIISTFPVVVRPLARDLLEGGTAWADNTAIAALAGDRDAVSALSGSAGQLTTSTASSPGAARAQLKLILDADADQRLAIEAVLSGADVVVRGAPGTGKSQSIANAVAALADQGKRVLVVTHKRAALTTVASRMAAVGLEDLVLDTGSSTKFAQLLRDSLTAAAQAPGPAQAQSTRLDELTELLDGYHARLHQPIQPWQVSAYEARAGVLSTPPEARTGVRRDRSQLLPLAGATHDEARRAMREFAELGGLELTATSSVWFAATPDTDEAATTVAAAVNTLRSTLLTACRDATTRAALEVGIPAPTDLRQAADVADLLVGVDETQQLFTPTIWDAPLDDLVSATADRSARRTESTKVGTWRRRQLRHDVSLALVNPAAPPDRQHLHEALVKARAYKATWAALARDNKGPRLGPNVQRAVDSVDDVNHELSVIRSVHPDAALDSPDYQVLLTQLNELAGDEVTLLKLPRIRANKALLVGLGLGELVEELSGRSQVVDPATAVAAYDHCRLASIADIAPLGFDAETASTTTPRLEAAVAEFRDLDLAQLEVTAADIKNAWSHRVAASRGEHREQSKAFESALSPQRRPIVLHDLVQSAPDVLFSLKPVWLAAAAAVPLAIPADTHFDVAIIDEASLLSPGDAAPALARARQIVLVGDERQLSPTPFSASPIPTPDPTDPLETVIPIGSVLDAFASVLPSYSLTGHYRSHDERLLTFSNANFYGGSLLAAPGIGGSAVLSLDIVGQAPGTKDQEESADAEVARVVELVLDHSRTRPSESLGVIALGRTHAERIDEALRRELLKQSRNESFFAESTAEPFFVKNLERVQGDERDAIILTTGYGRASDGRLLYRFGAINQPGGERRLNVAVTRARKRLLVVSGFGAEDLEPRRLAADGTRLLRDFLAYAASGGSALHSAEWFGVSGGPRPMSVEPEPSNDPLEADIAARLAGSGIRVERLIGAGRWRVPVALRHPHRPDQFVLAVETDGPGYRDAATVRERERLRPEHLQRLGWAVHRVWAADWLADPNDSLSRVLAAYERAVVASDKAWAHDHLIPEPADGPGAHLVDPQIARGQPDGQPPVLPAVTSDERPEGWGEAEDSNDSRLLEDRPPHW